MKQRIKTPVDNYDGYARQTPQRGQAKIQWQREGDGLFRYGASFAGLDAAVRQRLQGCFRDFNTDSAFSAD